MQADVFCRVVDNFGDIGVTWRLTRQLQHEHHWSLRLWVDDLKSFQRLEPRVVLDTPQQILDDIEIVHWVEPAPDLIPRAVVLSSFSCNLPDCYIARLHQHHSIWVNLEYLSAEAWVEGYHGLPSLRGDGLRSHFFFPGFNARTGGLLRERDLVTRRDQWLKDPRAQHQLLKRLGVSEAALKAWHPDFLELEAGDAYARTPQKHSRSTALDATDSRTTKRANVLQGRTELKANARLISLFCYPTAPVAQLIEALGTQPRPSLLLIPEGIATELLTGRYGLFEQVYLERIPFVSQPEYDQLLWTAELNFVRGEDSFVRALWAGKPLVWQLYPQTEGTHLIKLDAWLDRSGLPESIKHLILVWNTDPVSTTALQGLTEALAAISYQEWLASASLFSQALTSETDFAQKLVDFCTTKAKQSR